MATDERDEDAEWGPLPSQLGDLGERGSETREPAGNAPFCTPIYRCFKFVEQCFMLHWGEAHVERRLSNSLLMRT